MFFCRIARGGQTNFAGFVPPLRVCSHSSNVSRVEFLGWDGMGWGGTGLDWTGLHGMGACGRKHDSAGLVLCVICCTAFMMGSYLMAFHMQGRGFFLLLALMDGHITIFHGLDSGGDGFFVV